LRYDHGNSSNRTFFGAEAASDAGLFIRHIRASVRVIVICRFRQIKTVDRTGIDANPAGHAGHAIELRSLPERPFYHWTGNAKGILQCRRRTDAPAGPALNAPLCSNDVKRILISCYCIGRAIPLACAAAIALIRNLICHVPRHGVLNGQYSLLLVSPSLGPTQIVYNNRLSIFPCQPFFPGSLLRSAPVSR
jgi:hypothetical protein